MGIKMSLHIKFYWKTAFLLVLLSSCAHDDFWTDGDYYHLEHKGAILPIWVKGNIDSGIFLFTIHGGPTTASGHEFSLSPGFRELEKDYAVVYWDQRESGMAQGRPQDHSHTLTQYTEDARYVYQLIKEKYNPPSIFLLGHSWGGAIGHTLLLDESFQDQLNGWILVDGMSNDPKEMAEMRKWTLDKADSLIAIGERVDFWDYCKNWYAENPNYSSLSKQPYQFAVAAGGDLYDDQRYRDSAKIDFIQLALNSPFSTDYLFSQVKATKVDYTGWDVSSELHKIRLPSLIIWGKHDGIIPVSLAHDCYALYGTPMENKELAIFNYSAHSPHFEEPITFARRVRDFIDQTLH
jgi:proline iminopeptidase